MVLQVWLRAPVGRLRLVRYEADASHSGRDDDSRWRYASLREN
jgi:hypothetical protein